MPGRNLPNKPLVEAIFELHWALAKREGSPPGLSADPNYKLLLGRMFERLTGEYPSYKQLPSAVMPDELAANIVQHQFRAKEDGWPLVQLGPGVLTVNDTAGYDWTPFRDRSERAVRALFEAYPKREGPPVERLMLRYLDAFRFDWRENDAFAFIAENLKLQLSVPSGVLDMDRTDPRPHEMLWQAQFRCNDPYGLLNVKLVTGEANGQQALVLDTAVDSQGAHVPSFPEGFRAWADGAHKLATDLFFNLIQGELEMQFRGQNANV